jgi:hypothetical protein
MSNDPTNNTDNNITIDELASRLIDRDIEMSEVPHELRTTVNARAAEFGTNRQQLLAALPHVDGSTIDDAVQRAVIAGKTQSKPRRLGMYVASLAAAAAVVAIVGVAVTQSGSSDQSVSDMAFSAKMSPEVVAAPESAGAPADMTADSFAPMAADSTLSGAKTSYIINDINELQDLVSEWSVEGSVVPQKTEPLCDDPLRPAIDIETTFAGEPAEIHFSIADGIVVYRTDNCDMMGGIVP